MCEATCILISEKTGQSRQDIKYLQVRTDMDRSDDHEIAAVYFIVFSFIWHDSTRIVRVQLFLGISLQLQ